MSPVDTIDTASLRKLYEENPSAKAAFDHFARRQNNSAKTTVDRLHTALRTSGHEVSRRDVIELFKVLQEARCGRFVIGRRGQPSRFEWTVGLTDVGRVAAGEQVKVEKITAAETADFDNNGADASELVEHRYRLRADLELTVALPMDLTPAEADRLACFIKTLPLS